MEVCILCDVEWTLIEHAQGWVFSVSWAQIIFHTNSPLFLVTYFILTSTVFVKVSCTKLNDVGFYIFVIHSES
jgi:hypothetical protein